MEPGLPWARWVIQAGHPVGLKTQLGVLIAGDDGNIYIACANNRAYAIEIIIKPECVDDIISFTPTTESQESINPGYSLGPHGVQHGPGRVSHELAEPWSRRSPSASALMRQMYRESKRNGGPAHLRTNIGLELFDDLMLDLDLKAWKATSIPLEHISQTSEIDRKRKWFSGEYLEYKAREVKLGKRSTDREIKVEYRTYESRMAKAFHSIISFIATPAWYSTIWVASPGVAFLPSVADIDWDCSSEVERRKQARITSQHALENMIMNRSECSWEFDAWRDIFSKVRDDPLLAMDKHEATFLEKKSLDRGSQHRTGTPLGEHTVRAHRIPDCTFGLSVSSSAPVAVAGSDNLSETLLNGECLKDLFWHPESGLVSDPKWLSFELAFPLAVYEAKKTRAGPVLAQVQRSSEIYLNMLHDLCLQPGRPESARTYQNHEKDQFQVFSMTSEGPHWRLYVCYRRLISEGPHWLQDPVDIPQYDMKPIWEGDITDEKMAWQLHCLVDQIHEWAVNFFRPFVLDHLEAWNAYVMAAQTPYPIQGSIQATPLNLDSDTSQTARQNFRMRMEPSLKYGTKEALDILDQQVSQQELENQLEDSVEALQELPWWSKYAKPEVTRQRLLNGESPHPNVPKKPRKRPKEFREGRRNRREVKKLREAYDAQESRQNADKVLSPSLQKAETMSYYGSPTTPAWP